VALFPENAPMLAPPLKGFEELLTLPTDPGVTPTIAPDGAPTQQLVSQPARYLGNELGAFHKPWEDAAVRWVLTYPEVYEVGASNLGHIILYNILNTQPGQLCDRAYLPFPDLAKKLRSTQTPLWGVEQRRPLTEFDILGFSLSYELGATNILEMLDLAGIPLTWQERQSHGKLGNWPIIFAGGQTATSNPEPYADFFDFIALGDGEELLPEIGLVIAEGKAANLSRQELLLDLAQIPGVYVPQFYDVAPDGAVRPNRPDVPDRILRRVAKPIPAYSIGLVPYMQTVHDRLTIEIRRGCTRGCRFCQPGMLTRPARDVEPEAVVSAIEEGMRATGYNEFSLLSLSCSDYLALPAVGMEVKNRLKDYNVSLSLPSQRVDRFDENIANIIGGTRQSGLTFAPEAGTQRLRDIINKGLTNEELLRGVKTAFDQGWDKVKLYFMIGLPGETDADVLGIAETVQWLQQECRAPNRRRISFNLTISNFTPKPHTPFQWHSVSTEDFERKQAMLRAEFRRMRGVKANFTDVRISAMEDFVGRGDRTLAPIIRRAWELGAGMDSWFESIDRAYHAWTQAIQETGGPLDGGSVGLGDQETGGPSPSLPVSESPRLRVSPSPSLPLSPSPRLPVSLAPLPWDHIDTGIDKQWLIEDFQRACDEATVPDCSFEGCSHCGVCGTDFGHNIVVPPPPVPQFTGHFQPNQNRVQRLRVWFGKLGEMRFVSHLDVVRLFDRAVRRAQIPIAYTGGYHPGPRISVASALPLGATSSSEIVDFELAAVMDIGTFKEKLAAQFPPEMPIYRVEEVELKSDSATAQLERAEYIIGIAIADGEPGADIPWQEWISQILASTEILWEHTTKSGKKQMVNLRDRLFELELTATNQGQATLRYAGTSRNDGNQLRPVQLLHMLETVANSNFELRHIHRQQLILAIPPVS